MVDWQHQFATTLECANGVFSADFGEHFEVAEFRSLRPRADEEKLDGVLAEITRDDDGAGVDWVIVLARAAPRFAVSADDLGLAPLLGKHWAMRAMSDAHEYEAIERVFTKLSEEERQKLYHTRKQHKLCTVFLHELAHTLGVPHERTQSSLMSPRYNVEASGFSDEAARIVRASLQARERAPGAFLDASSARALSSALNAPDSEWESSSRELVLRQIASSGQASAPQAAPEATAVAAVPVSPPVAGFSAAEQASYERARAELAAGHAGSARALAAPLIAKHADLPAVQDLRCNIAMAAGGDPETLGAECAAFSRFGAK